MLKISEWDTIPRYANSNVASSKQMSSSGLPIHPNDSWSYLRNASPFHMNSIDFDGNVPCFSEISPDVFNANMSSDNNSNIPMNSLKCDKSDSSSKDISEPIHVSKEIEEKFRLTNQNIFSNGVNNQQLKPPNIGMQIRAFNPSSSQSIKTLVDVNVDSMNWVVNDSSDSAKDKRRERNKVFARKTRLKRKLELEDMRDKVCALKLENDVLKSILNQKLPPSASDDIITNCEVALPEHMANLVTNIVSRMKNTESRLISSLLRQQKSFIICSVVSPDCPIVYASPGFCLMTGYEVHSVLGRNCRFLQGLETDRRQVAKLKRAIKEFREAQVILRNYRQDGTAFWNFLQIAPLKDLQGVMTLIVGVLVEVDNPSHDLCELRVLNSEDSPFLRYSKNEEVMLPTTPFPLSPRQFKHLADVEVGALDDSEKSCTESGTIGSASSITSKGESEY